MSEPAANAPRFAILRIYLKDLSFESPQAPDLFAAPWQPKVHLDLNTRSQHKGEDRYEVVLTMTLRATAAEDRTAYIVEVQQAGLFQVANLPPDHLAQTLATLCPTILFPYARETIDSLAVKGTFAPVMLAPVNFDVLFAQAMKQKADAAAATAAAKPADVRH
jgi:preprotein translocase subunit SecB